MYGIIGYTGPLEAKDLLLNGLSGLKYRGYDSAGVAYFNAVSRVKVIKKVGKMVALRECTKKIEDISHRGIGHTRWATHRDVTNENAHPHHAEQVTLIHNGIIEDYHQLTEEYGIRGRLVSQTDSEVAAWILDAVHEEYSHDPLIAIRTFVKKLEGSYGFCILFDDRPGGIYATRSVSSLVASCAQSGTMMASDLTALISFIEEYSVIPGHHILRLTPYKIRVYDMNCFKIRPEMLEVNWDMDAAMKNGFPHFMLREIHEQLEALGNAIPPRLAGGLPDFTSDRIPDELFTDCRQIHIVACGMAMHTDMVTKALMEPLFRIPVAVSTASEFRYGGPLVDKSIPVIVISQSGEAIGALAAVRLAESLDSRTLSIISVKESTIVRGNGHMLYTRTGPKIAVASTKACSVQLAALYMLCCRMALSKERCNEADAREFIEDLLVMIPAMESMIGQSSHIKSFVRRLIHGRDTLFIGKGLDYTFSLEGALKLKEIPYIHAEAYTAGGLKHGTIALIYGNVPVIVIATQDHIPAKAISNIREVKAKGAYVILLAKEQAAVGDGVSDVELRIPNLEGRFTVFPIAVALQLTVYCASIGKNLDVDQPRSLARSVTVE